MVSPSIQTKQCTDTRSKMEHSNPMTKSINQYKGDNFRKGKSEATDKTQKYNGYKTNPTQHLKLTWEITWIVFAK